MLYLVNYKEGAFAQMQRRKTKQKKPFAITAITGCGDIKHQSRN